MVELRYTGQAPTPRIWRGLITGTRYLFGPGDVRYVDKRDAHGWLNPKRGEGRVFEHDRSQDD